MRSFALGTFALALGLAACNGDKETFIGSATEGTAADTTGPGTTEAPDLTTTTATTGGPSTTSTQPTTGEPEPTTAGTTMMPPETTTGTTEEPGTTTVEETTGMDPVFPQGTPYGDCSNEMGNVVKCDANSLCLDNNNVEIIDGAFCSQ